MGKAPPFEPLVSEEIVQDNFALRAAARLGLIKTFPVKVHKTLTLRVSYAKPYSLGNLSEWLASAAMQAPAHAQVTFHGAIYPDGGSLVIAWDDDNG